MHKHEVAECCEAVRRVLAELESAEGTMRVNASDILLMKCLTDSVVATAVDSLARAKAN